MRVIRAEQLTRSAQAHPELERACIYRARCRVAGVVMELRTDLPEVARLFALRYAEHASTQEPDFTYYVAQIRMGYAFWCAHAPSWRWSQGTLPPDAVLFLTDTVAMSALIRFDARIASMQAAAIEYSGVAAAIAGHSTTAKTTTLLACVRRGMRVYSDERALLKDNVVQPFLRRCSARAAGARLLLTDSETDDVPDGVNNMPELSLKTCFGMDAIAEPQPLRALFVIAGNGHCAGLEAIDTSTALPAISRWYETRGDMVDRVARAIVTLRTVKCYRLTLGKPDETSAAIAYALTRIAATL